MERTLHTCSLQPYTEEDDAVYATMLPHGDVLLVAHGEPTPDTDSLGDAVCDITLTADGWTTLIEMYALRRPEAFAQVCAKVCTYPSAQRATQIP